MIFSTLATFFSLQLLQACLAYDGLAVNPYQGLQQGVTPTLGGIIGGTLKQVVGRGIQGVAQQILQPTVSYETGPNLYQRKQAEATISSLENEEKITDLNKTARKISDEYKQIEQEIAGPLEAQTAALKNERNLIIKKLSKLTKTLRYKHDLMHPELINNPIILVAKNRDDEMRAEANKIDAQGLLDIKNKVSSPLAAYHKMRVAEKSAVQESSNNKNIDIEVETLNKMPVNERLNYDQAMAQQKRNEIKDIEDQIKALDKEARSRRIWG